MATKQEKEQKNIKNIQFAWIGKDKNKNEVRGEIISSSESAVRMLLRSKGITPIKVSKKGFKLNKEKKITTAEIAVLTRQLSTMMKSGVPLLQSFDIVANGNSLSVAFSKHPKYFEPLYCNLVEAGEKAGILDTILDRLAVYQEKMQGIKKKIKSALTYPIAVMGVAFIVTAIIMIFVVPSFKQVFASFGAELPAPTLMVMAISDFMVANWYIIFGSLGAFIWFIGQAIQRNEKARNLWDRFLLKMPIFGKIIYKAVVARWARTLATMFAAGVPLVDALDSVAGASGNVVFYNATKIIQKEVTTGQSLTVSMQTQNIFPNMMIQMAQIGEESGSLDDMLNKVAEFYEEEVDNAVASLSSLMEPLIISFLGIVIGGLVVAMYLPIFKMASAV